ncbi:MAG TPA: hypothetical protein VMU93_10170 [Caulobacteraceae bacterium]|nr:hypothetical protein [Caulobacteraceae bacterium]
MADAGAARAPPLRLEEMPRAVIAILADVSERAAARARRTHHYHEGSAPGAHGIGAGSCTVTGARR